MRESKVPTFDTIEELSQYVSELVSQNHDYGTCCYAMSMSAVAAFNFVARKLGVTSFQASCADLDILRRTRNMERFQVSDLSNLLYPQYADKFKSFDEAIVENSEWLSKRAAELLIQSPEARPNVLSHWRFLASLQSNAPGRKIRKKIKTTANSGRVFASHIPKAERHPYRKPLEEIPLSKRLQIGGLLR